ncbi:MAG TPA: outer membrane beta-barrel protein, partial [Chitinophagales bacterium]|nr:outer membrane beta-barrel protein [Chitinophagales bacterium]
TPIMKVLILVLLSSVFTWFTCEAQSMPGSKFNAGLEVAIPAGKVTSTYKTGFGGSLKYEYRADTGFYFTLSAGYISFPVTDNAKLAMQQAGYNRSSFGFIPIKIGGKFYIGKQFFGEVQLGNTFEVNVDRLASGAASAFTFSPGAGYSFDNGLELGARYEGWFTSGLFSQYAFRVAYRFRL